MCQRQLQRVPRNRRLNTVQLWNVLYTCNMHMCNDMCKNGAFLELTPAHQTANLKAPVFATKLMQMRNAIKDRHLFHLDTPPDRIITALPSPNPVFVHVAWL